MAQPTDNDTKAKAKRGSRWRLVRDVIVFQVKCGMEAVLDVTLIPVSMVAAGLDLLFGNWRRPRLFHAVLRFGERCEDWINLWGVAPAEPEVEVEFADRRGADRVMQQIEALIRNPQTGPETLRTLRLWAAAKIAGDMNAAGPPAPGRDRDATP
jgi:hypothetical protein